MPGSAAVTVLPNDLCGTVPKQPKLWMVDGSGAQYPVVNSLGSCFQDSCNPVSASEPRRGLWVLVLLVCRRWRCGAGGEPAVAGALRCALCSVQLQCTLTLPCMRHGMPVADTCTPARGSPRRERQQPVHCGLDQQGDGVGYSRHQQPRRLPGG